PGPVALAVCVAPACGEVGGLEDLAVEVGGTPVPACWRGKDEAKRVGAGLLLGACLLDAGGEPGREGVAAGCALRVDRAALLAVFRCLDVEVPGDFDDLAVYRDHPGGL